jgi:hypothetical protein
MPYALIFPPGVSALRCLVLTIINFWVFRLLLKRSQGLDGEHFWKVVSRASGRPCNSVTTPGLGLAVRDVAGCRSWFGNYGIRRRISGSIGTASSIGRLLTLAISNKFKRLSVINCFWVPVGSQLRIYLTSDPDWKFFRRVPLRCKLPGLAMLFPLGRAPIAGIPLLIDKNALRFIGGCNKVLSCFARFWRFVVVSFHFHVCVMHI